MSGVCQPLWANTCSEIFIKNSPKPLGERWPEDGPNPFRAYESSFSDLLRNQGVLEHQNYFQTFLKARKTRGLSTNALDLMGSGYFLPNPRAADSITGLRYRPLLMSELEIEKYGRNQEVVGDIFDRQTWNDLNSSLVRRNIDKIDLIVMRPVAGWNNYPFNSTDHEAQSLVFVLSNSLSILSQTGEIYFSLELRQFKGNLARHPEILKFKDWGV